MNTYLILALMVLNAGCAPNSNRSDPKTKNEAGSDESGDPTGDEGDSDTAGGDDGADSEAPTPDDEERYTADLPVEVSGAFFTKVETGEFDNLTAKSGHILVGINVFASFSQSKVEDPVKILELKFESEGKTHAFKPLKYGTKKADLWHAIFEVPTEFDFPYKELSVTVSVSESANFVLAASTLSSSIGEPQAPSTEVGPRPEVVRPLANVSEHILFVSSKTYKPGKDFTSIKNANALCNIEAESAGLDTFWWLAVLADDSWFLEDRLRLYGPIKNVTGNDLLSITDVLHNKSLPNNMLQTADGTVVSEITSELVFTGVTKTGATGETCSSWGSSAGEATVGLVSSPNDWLTSTVVNCSEPRRLYCINSKIRSK